MEFSISEINSVLGLINWNDSINNSLFFNKITIDSREVSFGDLFVAIKGEKYNGHDFIQEAISKGVSAAVVNEEYKDLVPKYCPYWIVPNTVVAYQDLALLKRRKLNIPVIGITGSVGKTTTKEISLEVLKNYGKVKVTEKNNNNEIGVGLTIHSCDENHKLLVVEMGMRGIGQIEELSRIAEPDIAVITNIGTSHIGLLGSRNNIAKAKCEITRYLNPNGIVIIPYGDNLLDQILKSYWKGRVLKVKINSIDDFSNSDTSKENIISGFYDKKRNIIKVDEKTFEISFRGFHNAINFLYVYAISKELNINFNKYTKFNFRSLDGRNKILRTKKLILMDESYNASPESLKACIKVLFDYPGKHFLIFGSIRELGDKSVHYHKDIIELINNSDIKFCIFLCESDLEINLRNSCLISSKILFTNNKNSISFTINKLTSKGDSLLIKGSRFWELEKIIPFID